MQWVFTFCRKLIFPKGQRLRPAAILSLGCMGTCFLAATTWLPRWLSNKEFTCENLLEEEMATHSNIFAWEMPWTEEPGGLQSMGSQRVRHDWACVPAATLDRADLTPDKLSTKGTFTYMGLILQIHIYETRFF